MHVCFPYCLFSSCIHSCIICLPLYGGGGEAVEQWFTDRNLSRVGILLTRTAITVIHFLDLLQSSLNHEQLYKPLPGTVLYCYT